MNENCSAAKQEVGGASRGFEKLADRIADRLLPDEPENGTHGFMKGFAISAGMILWFSYGWVYRWEEKFTGANRGANRGENSGVLEQLPPDWTVTFYVIPALSLIILGFFIYKSFDRGRPLTFFFWGLIFPSIIMNMLDFTFR